MGPSGDAVTPATGGGEGGHPVVATVDEGTCGSRSPVHTFLPVSSLLKGRVYTARTLNVLSLFYRCYDTEITCFVYRPIRSLFQLL